MTMRQHRKRATQLNVKTQNSAGCQNMPISWDATAGKAPWTVMIAPVNQVPYTFDVPQASGSNFAVNWAVPKLSKDAQTLVAVSDSTGAYSGVSSFVTVSAGTGSCSAISDSLDFIWFPTKNSDTPDQCADWAITWQQDKGNNGVTGQVSYTFLPENGQPVTVAAGTGNTGSFIYNVPFTAGTRFLAIGNDGGKAGTGGVGDLYTVSAGKRTKTCSASNNIGNGLPNPSATMSAASTSTATSSSTSKSGRTKTTSSAASATNTSNTNSQNTSSDTSSGKSSTAGTAAGATVGVLAGLAILGLLIWWFRRRRARAREEEKAWGGAAKLGSVGGASGSAGGANAASNDSNYPVSPWRWSASPFDPPQTTNKGSSWARRVSGSGAAATGAGAAAAGGAFRLLGSRHNQQNSTSSGAQPTMQQASFRNMSVPNDGHSGAPPVSELQMPHQMYGQAPDGSGQSIHSTVPDAALFPPPNPMSYGMYDDSPYGAARSTQQQQQYMQQPVYNDDPRSRSPFRDPSPHSYGGAGVGAVGMAYQTGAYGGPTSEIRQGTTPTQDSYDASSGPTRTLTNSSQGHNSLKSTSGPAQIHSEVMLADHGRYDNKGHVARKTIPEEDEEEGLPYL